MRLLCRLLLVVVTLVPGALRAQDALEGEYPGLETGKMWTFDTPPREYWAKRYNFTPPEAWLGRVQRSALRYGNICSASFVSGEGLVMTNHHCARGCIESATREGEDFLSNGFYAAKREDERVCQGLFLDQLEEITDVTDRVSRAAPATATAKAAAAERAKVIKAIEEDCGKAAEVSCQVVTMYRGGQYKLYRFQRYNDVRLVFAPEGQIAFFGGDPDNFTYPRWNLDMSFVRAYADGKPAATPHHFSWSPSGTREGDLTFVIGNPGSTGRLNTMAQLEFLRDVQYPVQLDQLKRLNATYHALSQSDTARARALRNTIFSLENSLKAITGYQTGLLDPRLMAHKRAWEKSFRARVDGDPALRRQYGRAWVVIADVSVRRRQIDVRRRYHAAGAYGSRLLTLALGTLRYGSETAKPDTARLLPYQEANRQGLERNLFGGAPVDLVQEKALLTAYFTAMRGELPVTDPVLRQALLGRTSGSGGRRHG